MPIPEPVVAGNSRRCIPGAAPRAIRLSPGFHDDLAYLPPEGSCHEVAFRNLLVEGQEG